MLSHYNTTLTWCIEMTLAIWYWLTQTAIIFCTHTLLVSHYWCSFATEFCCNVCWIWFCVVSLRVDLHTAMIDGGILSAITVCSNNLVFMRKLLWRHILKEFWKCLWLYTVFVTVLERALWIVCKRFIWKFYLRRVDAVKGITVVWFRISYSTYFVTLTSTAWESSFVT